MMSGENPNSDRSAEEIRIDWPGFDSVSELAPSRFQSVDEASQFADEVPPRKQPVELAGHSVAEGASLASAAKWFDVSPSELAAWVSQGSDDAASQIKRPVDPQPGAETNAAEAAEVAPPRPAAVRPRPSLTDSTPTVYSLRADGTRRRPDRTAPMGFVDSVHVLKRRILVVVAGLVLGASAGWLTAPGRTAPATRFRAVHTLFFEQGNSMGYNIEQVALLATSGEVPGRVAERLKLDRAQVRSAVSAAAEQDVRTIAITGRSPQAATAESLANVTAEELVAEIDGVGQAAYQSQLSHLTAQVAAAEKFLATIQPKDNVGQAAARNDLAKAQQALQDYQIQGPPKSEFRTLEKASARPVAAAGVQLSNSKSVRALLLGAFGLFLGIAGAFARERLDSRIRSKSSAEEAFGVPVIAEVPPISKASQGKLLTLTEPTSPFVEAYRGLRTYVALWAPETARDDGHRVIVVTSPAPGEGKTTTVAHLAAMLAEIGRSVVVISADLRRPRLHQFFDASASPGLIDRLTATNGSPTFDGLDQPTSVRGVRLVTSGPPTANPAPMIEHAGNLVRSVRGLADFVLIDSPPILVANDGVELARHADGVLLVARAGQTPLEAAEHSAEVLERLGIPIVGAVLVGSEAASSAYRFYAARYYGDPDRTGRGPHMPTGNGTAEKRSPAAETSTASEEAPPASGK